MFLCIDRVFCGCPCRVLHNYMMWHLVKMMSSYLSKPFQDVKQEFIKVLTGQQFLDFICIQ